MVDESEVLAAQQESESTTVTYPWQQHPYTVFYRVDHPMSWKARMARELLCDSMDDKVACVNVDEYHADELPSAVTHVPCVWSQRDEQCAFGDWAVKLLQDVPQESASSYRGLSLGGWASSEDEDEDGDGDTQVHLVAQATRRLQAQDALYRSGFGSRVRDEAHKGAKTHGAMVEDIFALNGRVQGRSCGTGSGSGSGSGAE